jgi:pimeloyl-ACP methyl ester carboxylesterase
MANNRTVSGETRRHMLKRMVGAAALAGSSSFDSPLNAASRNLEGKVDVAEVRHSTVKVGPVTVFYREAGLEGRPVLLLLHGFANSSHYFRHLMPLLANRFHLIAPDLPSFGFTKVEGKDYRYSFAQLTETTQGFVDALGLRRFAMYVFDYGAPIGFNLAVADPGRVTAIISQNGNAYEEGLGEGPWAPLRAYWKQPSVAIRDKLKERMSLDGVRAAYFNGVRDVSRIEPETYWLDAALLAQPGMMDLQVDLKLDYKSNLERYPLYHEYFRTHRPPLLAIWGKNDIFFIPPGAEAFKRDLPNADVQFLDTGHFALETNVEDIASAILKMRMRGED